jgi:hypothetical protein
MLARADEADHLVVWSCPELNCQSEGQHDGKAAKLAWVADGPRV